LRLFLFYGNKKNNKNYKTGTVIMNNAQSLQSADAPKIKHDFKLFHDVNERLRDTGFYHAFDMDHSSRGNKNSIIWNLMSGAATVLATLIPGLSVTAVAAVVGQILNLGDGGFTDFVNAKAAPESPFKRSTAFKEGSEFVKAGLQKLVENADMKMPEGLPENVDRLRDALQTIGNGNKIQMATRFALAAGTLAAVVATSSFAAPTVIGGALAMNAENILFSAWNMAQVKKVDTLLGVINKGIGTIGQVMNAKLHPGPAAVPT